MTNDNPLTLCQLVFTHQQQVYMNTLHELISKLHSFSCIEVMLNVIDSTVTCNPIYHKIGNIMVYKSKQPFKTFQISINI